MISIFQKSYFGQVAPRAAEEEALPISQFLVKYTNKVKTKKETGNALDGDSALQLAKQLRPQRVVAVAGPGGPGACPGVTGMPHL